MKGKSPWCLFETYHMYRVATGQGKVREVWFSSRSGKSWGILQIGQGNFKYQESQGKVREFHNFGPKYVLYQVFWLLEMWKKCWFFKSVVFFARSNLWKLVNFRTFGAKKLFKDFICFICRIREVHFSELVKGICHLSAARRQIGHKTAVFWSVKSQGILFLHEGGHPELYAV